MKDLSAESKNKKIIEYAVFALFLLLVFLVQNTGKLFPAPGGVHAVLLIPAVVSVAMFKREFAGLFYGLFCGIMLDAFSAKTLCFHSVAFTVTGFAAGMLITYLLRNNIICCFALTLFFSLSYNFFYYFCFVLFSGEENPVFVFFRYYFLSTVYTSVISPVFYLITRRISKSFR